MITSTPLSIRLPWQACQVSNDFAILLSSIMIVVVSVMMMMSISILMTMGNFLMEIDIALYQWIWTRECCCKCGYVTNEVDNDYFADCDDDWWLFCWLWGWLMMTWMKKSLGFPARLGQRSAVNGCHTFVIILIMVVGVVVNHNN